MRRQASLHPGLVVVPLLLVDSLHFVFARLLLPQIDPFISAMYVLAIATVQVGVYGLISGKLSLSILRHNTPFFLAIGFCIAVSTVINYAAVAYIDPGTAAMLGKTSILFGLLFGVSWLGERLNRVQIAGTALALLGLIIVTFQPVEYLRFGSLLVLSSAFLYSIHAALTKRYRGEMDLLNFFFYRLLFTTFFLFVIGAGQGALALPEAGVWPYLIATGTIDVVVSRSLYYTTLRRLDMSVFSIILALSPVAAILWSMLLFDVFPGHRQLLGGAGVLLGVLLVTGAPGYLARRRQGGAVVQKTGNA